MRRMSTQRGAVAVTVAILMVAMVGFTAIAVDAGAIWMDRKELQNGADAAALALAQSCAEGACEVDEHAVASDYAEGNKRDAKIDSVAVQNPGLDGDQSVTVTVTSNRAHWFAPIIGHDSSNVAASATASWGTIGGAKVLPLAVSDCALDFVDDGSSITFWLKGPPPKKDEPVPDCPMGGSPHVIPGGFGWLDVTDGEKCLAETSIDGGAASKPGAPETGTTNCDVLLQGLEGDEILLPLYDHVEGAGAGGIYTIVAYAHLRVLSYCLSKGQGWYYWPAGTCNSGAPHDDPPPVEGKGAFIRGTLLGRVSLDAVLGGGVGTVGSTTVKLSK